MPLDLSKFKAMVDNEISNVHTIYIAKVLAVNGDMAKIQPLTLLTADSQYGEKQAVLFAPIPRNVKKITTQNVVIDGTDYTLAVANDISKDDIVIVGCGERDITDTRRGYFSLPQKGHHRISDSIIIGVI
ncbi:MAG: hypothetical protein IJH40_07055 [Ruminococcus sp.]|uniref:hypothetical protein n=1 Tax=Ruminococcus sp. TaxID=41978 RepID=UPI002873F31E|nr:hypothetical protein [Ruminococcus sp.]MBQ3285383.1 hypothetical protein [Ruminococcus sp.]